MKLYIDDKNMCHLERKEGYREVESHFFDSIPPLAIEYYKFIPEKNFIQCTNSFACDLITKQYKASEEKYDKIIKELQEEKHEEPPMEA